MGGLVLLVLTSAHAAQSSVACKLLHTAELESALGGKAAQVSGGSLGDADMCSGQVGKLKVLIRVAKCQGDVGGRPDVFDLDSAGISRANGL